MKLHYFGKRDAHTVLIQPVGEHDFPLISAEIAQIKARTDEQDFLLATVQVDGWNDDLSPWQAPAVWGKDAFDGGGAKTLAYIENEVIAKLKSERFDGKNDRINAPRKFYLGGYSLAGLFALWAAYQTDAFRGIAAVSPSVWFPGFVDFVQANALYTDAVYLSLGDKEEKTKHPVMSQVGTAIRTIHEHIKAVSVPTALEWTPGNHFREPEMRVSMGFAWLLNREEENCNI